MNLRLGIDTGGTYTDAVLVDDDQQIIVFSKSLTTRHDLTFGIGNALEALPGESLAEIRLVALSTTLSTNSVVEGRGAPVCILLPGYRQQQIDKSGLADIVESELIIPLAGGHDAVGNEQAPLDEELARKAILRNKAAVSAFGVSSMFGVRNPEHEIRLCEVIGELSSKPVTCGHELSSGLDAPRRALTVALNARMVPTIHELIMSMQEIMRRKNISAPLMMVKGDGSLVNLETALRQPVGTVLSGPAASVIGACALSGEKNAIIADMGGTTTDIAIVTDGQPELDYEGVRIGDCRPMVEAVRVFSLGLGGDSEVHFGGSKGIEIGPRRVIPMSLLGQQHPEIIDRLKNQLVASPNARNNRFAMRLEQNEVLISRLSEVELHAWNLLADQPLELQVVVEEDRDAARALARLHRRGLVIFSGFTPTDAAHVLGFSEHWSREAAELSAKIWARQMRHVYGLGRWADGDAQAPSSEVFQRVINSIGQALVDAGLHQHDLLQTSDSGRLSKLLARLIIEPPARRSSAGQAKDIFHLSFASHHPVVAVGAPASCWYPQAAQMLGAELRLPENAEVANAYGAVLGSVVQRAHVTVAQPRNGTFMLYSKREPMKFHDLEQAMRHAKVLASGEAEALALAAGSKHAEISLTSINNHVDHDIDGELFLETRITATATGRPSIDVAKEPAHASV